MIRLLLLLILATPGPCLAGEDTTATPPHVLLILADDLGWKDVGYHGSEIETPHLDRLASQGVRLEQFYVQPLCSPTRSSLMTGRYPMRQGLQTGVIWPWADWGVPLDERMLPQALKEAGYRTAICGKWHLGMQSRSLLPMQRGFDHQYGHYLGMIDYYTHLRDGGLDWHRNGKALWEKGYTTDLIGREAVRIVEGHDPSRPLFLYVAFNAPHTPLEAPREAIDRYRHIENRKRRVFAAMVTCMDEAVGEIVEAFQRRGMWKNTLTLFASDNGGPGTKGASNGDLRGGKGSLYEGGVRVPAFILWPGHLNAGRSVDTPMHIVDWYTTVLRQAGARLEQPLPLDGYDMWPVIAEGKASPRTEILHNVEPSRAALRSGEWKLVQLRRSSWWGPDNELFHITSDPYEKTNLARANPAKVAELAARIAHYAKQAIPPAGQNARKPLLFLAPRVWEPTR